MKPYAIIGEKGPEVVVRLDMGIDVDILRTALYNVGQRHDWENTVDREDRTPEIAGEYDRLLITRDRSEDDPSVAHEVTE